MTTITATHAGATRSVGVGRLAGAGALSFAVLGIVGGALVPPAPAADASAEKVRSFLSGHHGGIDAMAALTLLAALGLTLFFSGMRRRIDDGPEPERGLLAEAFYGFGLVTVAVVIIGGLLLAAAAQGVAAASAGEALVLFRLGRLVFYTAPAVSSGGYLLVAALAAVRYGVLPRWTAVIAVVGGIGGLVSSAGDLLLKAGFPSAIGFVGFLLAVVWTAAAGVILLRES